MSNQINTNLISFWAWLSGKKRTIALIYWTIVIPSMVVIWPEGAPVNFSKAVAVIGIALSATGLGHAVIKTKAVKA